LEALGYQADAADLAYLLQVVQDSKQLGYHNVIRCGALRALGHIQQPEAFEYLFKHWAQQPYLHARAAAIEGLARSASWQDSPASRRKTLQALTAIVSRDPVEANRRAAIQGLIMLEAGNQAAETVWESRVLFPEQDWPGLKSKIDALKSGSAGGSVELKKRVDQLEEQVKRLQGRLEEFEQKQTASLPIAVETSEKNDDSNGF
jgi:hypothetical protein